MEKWNGKVAVVTGASSGIGNVIAIKLAEHGMKVAALARREDKLKDISKHKGKGEIKAFYCDVTDAKMVKDVFSEITSIMGPIMVLINNAGIILQTTLADIEVEKWKLMFDVNVFGAFNCIRETLKAMKENESEELRHIINMNSIAGDVDFKFVRDYYPYGESKHCFATLTKGLIDVMAKEKKNVRFTSIHPGVVNTDFFTSGNYPEGVFGQLPHLECEDVAKVCITALSAEPNILISSVSLKNIREVF